MTSFVEQAKYMVYVFVAAGVIGLLVLIFTNDFGIAKNVIDFSFHERRLTLMRFFLDVYEFFWLIAIAWGFWKLAAYAGPKLSKEDTEKFEAFEPKFFKIMIGILVVAAILTLVTPIWVGNGLAQYNTRTDDDDKTVKVTAKQFDFIVEMDGQVDSNITFHTNVRYMFELTTLDTTHGFGLYTPTVTENDGRVFYIQAQIVPGYTTKLLVVFNEVGDWILRCMEYCSAGHHNMESDGINIPFLHVEA